MAFVVTESCIQCVYTDCVSVCPTDCFRIGPNFMVIDPADCIDCGLCVAECPVNAIVQDDDLPQNQRHFIQINADLSQQWRTITQRTAPLPDADKWSGVLEKSHLLLLKPTTEGA
ncbi:MAG: ferredoxin FdxA [Pseudomonadota bacterium]